MRKAEMVRRVADKTGLTYAKAEAVVNVILDEIKLTLEAGEPVILRRFGTFDVRAKRARPGLNPATGEVAEVAARRVVRVKAGGPLREAVKDAPRPRQRQVESRP